jgi:hypothetical protein
MFARDQWETLARDRVRTASKRLDLRLLPNRCDADRGVVKHPEKRRTGLGRGGGRLKMLFTLAILSGWVFGKRMS